MESEDASVQEWSLILDDSCLYPDGGGQPCDFGRVGDAKVLRVDTTPAGLQVIVDREFQIGEKVTCRVDWDRRYDFMQQHTCQHLLSAVVSILFNNDTVKWELGSCTVAVDFEREGAFSGDEIRMIEDQVNSHVRASRKVFCTMVDKCDLDTTPDLRGRPKGKALEMESLRLVTIEGLDSNPCGGTHLASTAEIQLFGIVGTETNRGAARLRFVCGHRALARFSACLTREAQLCATLGVGAGDLSITVDTLYADRREASKQLKNVTDELALLLGTALLSAWQRAAAPPPFIAFNRPNASLSFLQDVADAIMSQSEALGLGLQAVYLSGGATDMPGNKKGRGKQKLDPTAALPMSPDMPVSGPFVLYGSNVAMVGDIKDRLYEAIQAKGGGRPGKLQGQASRLQNMQAVEKLLLSIIV